MYRIKQDQRTIRSCQLIYDALAQLIYEKPFSKITVTEIVETAQVGRTTFYRCFDEIEDVLRMRCDQVFDELIAYMKVYRRESGRPTNPGGLLRPMLRYFYLDSAIIDLLLRADRLNILQKTFLERASFISPIVAEQLQISDVYPAYTLRIRVAAMCTILAHWVDTGKRETPDELTDTLQLLMTQQLMVIDYV